MPHILHHRLRHGLHLCLRLGLPKWLRHKLLRRLRHGFHHRLRHVSRHMLGHGLRPRCATGCVIGCAMGCAIGCALGFAIGCAIVALGCASACALGHKLRRKMRPQRPNTKKQSDNWCDQFCPVNQSSQSVGESTESVCKSNRKSSILVMPGRKREPGVSRTSTTTIKQNIVSY